MKRAILVAALLTPILAAGRDRQTVAVLINGGHQASSNYESHLVHLEGMADVLASRGVTDPRVFSSDGADPEPDMLTREPLEHADRWLLEDTCLAGRLPRSRLVDTPWDGPRQPATAEALSAWFSDPGLSAGDTLLLYTTDHGWRDKETDTAGLWLWGEKAAPDAMTGWLAALPDGVTTVMVMSHCYSGAFEESVMDGPLDGSSCGFFSAPADRRAYGCYPEGRSSQTMGHGFRFIDALADAESAAAAHERVLLTDRTPDVPLATSDLYLRRVVERDAAKLGVALGAHVDALLVGAEPDPLVAAMAEGVGLPVPGSMAEVAEIRSRISAAEALVKQRDGMWSSRLGDLARGNACATALDTEGLEVEALLALLRAHAESTGVWPLLSAVAASDRQAADILWRMEVREAVLLRIETRLITRAGEILLRRWSRRPQRQTLRDLRRCEAAPLGNPTRPAVPLPASWPSLSADLDDPALSPAFLGLRLEDISGEPGATSVTAVLDGQPGEAAGLLRGDVLLGPPDAPFFLPGQARAWAALLPVGEPVEVLVRRADGLHTVRITPAAFPPPNE